MSKGTGESCASDSDQKTIISAEEVLQRWKKQLTPGIRLTLLLSVILYLIMFIIGAVKFRECPLNDKIPFYVMTAGLMGVLSKALCFARQKLQGYFKFIKRMETTMYTAEFIWLIFGSYWVYSEFRPNYSAENGPHCDKTLYHLAFWTLTIQYSLLLLILLTFIAFAVGFCILMATAKSGEAEDELDCKNSGATQTV